MKNWQLNFLAIVVCNGTLTWMVQKKVIPSSPAATGAAVGFRSEKNP